MTVAEAPHASDSTQLCRVLQASYGEYARHLGWVPWAYYSPALDSQGAI